MRRRIGRLMASLRLKPSTETLIIACFLGALGGLASIGFKRFLEVMQELIWCFPKLTPEARGHGVPKVMIAVIKRNSVI